MAKRSRSGGWPYVLGAGAIVALSSELRAQGVFAFGYLAMFVLLSIARVVICNRLLRASDEAQAQVERTISVIYLIAALAWTTFLAWVFASHHDANAPVVIAVIATAGITAGGMTATIPWFRLMLIFGFIACPVGLGLLLLFNPEPANWVVLLFALAYFVFLAHNGSMQHEAHWSAWRQTQRLEQQALDLRMAREQAEAANKAKSVFLASMSHEIRTPMNGVLGMASILANTSLSEKQQRYLTTLQSSGRTLLRIIDDILDAAKIEAGTLAIAHQRFEPKQIIDEIELLFRPQALESHLVFEVHTAELPRYLMGDADRVKQILFNLISNAVKFTKHGSVSLNVNCTKQSSTEVTLHFEVADTGIGIAPEDQARLFERFVQVGTPAINRQGTGLGLSIARSLTALLNGKLALDSQTGRGTRIKVSLPFAVALESDAMAAASNANNTTSKRSFAVLLVEDHSINQEISEAMLGFLGHQVTLASNGLVAIESYLKHRPDVILMDCDMPEMDGFEATRRIRQLERERNLPMVPIVALTAHVFEDIKIQCSAAGMNAYLSKPYSTEQLQRVLDEVLSNGES